MLPEVWLPMEDLDVDGISPGALIQLTIEDGSTIVGIVMEYPKITPGGDSRVALLLGDRMMQLEHSPWYHPLTGEFRPLWAVWVSETEAIHHREHLPVSCKLKIDHAH